eukprot:TRINITY_DN390_c0_g1_i9.p1 TRINITY_DN390_c0_g1~~TRINITY_DN390_c0_g1_i9.p1  ORF type:complete len:259 (+),score=35.92 TRINITY_DN390_c0_g1_i9:703-1479(+)
MLVSDWQTTTQNSPTCKCIRIKLTPLHTENFAESCGEFCRGTCFKKSLSHISLSGGSDFEQTVVPEGLFRRLNNLKQLNIRYISISTVPERMFQDLANLRTLQLEHNMLKHLPPTLFQGLTNLEELRLSHNQLTILPETLFQGLTNLRLLALNSNNLLVLNPGMFWGCDSLSTIDLSQNPNLEMPDLSIWLGLDCLSDLWAPSAWPREYVMQALDESVKPDAWRLFEVLLVSRNMSHALMDHVAFITTTTPFVVRGST